MYSVLTYTDHTNQPNVDIYTSPMDPTGFIWFHKTCTHALPSKRSYLVAFGSFSLVESLGILGDEITHKYPRDIRLICAIGSINSHYFQIIGDKLINPIP